jgi:hypothetical protein
MKTQTINTDFADMIMEENNHLHIIAFNSDSVLAVDYNDNNKAHFFYKVNEDMSFHFNMLCEVGRGWQYWFEEMIKSLHYSIVSMETDTDYFDTLIKQA